MSAYERNLDVDEDAWGALTPGTTSLADGGAGRTRVYVKFVVNLGLGAATRHPQRQRPLQWPPASAKGRLARVTL